MGIYTMSAGGPKGLDKQFHVMMLASVNDYDQMYKAVVAQREKLEHQNHEIDICFFNKLEDIKTALDLAKKNPEKIIEKFSKKQDEKLILGEFKFKNEELIENLLIGLLTETAVAAKKEAEAKAKEKRKLEGLETRFIELNSNLIPILLKYGEGAIKDDKGNNITHQINQMLSQMQRIVETANLANSEHDVSVILKMMYTNLEQRYKIYITQADELDKILRFLGEQEIEAEIKLDEKVSSDQAEENSRGPDADKSVREAGDEIDEMLEFFEEDKIEAEKEYLLAF
jgi:hypothetical protein